jgi:amino acid permease
MSHLDYDEKKGEDVYDSRVAPADTYALPDQSYGSEEGQVQHVALKRSLKNRHIAMISIGGVM